MHPIDACLRRQEPAEDSASLARELCSQQATKRIRIGVVHRRVVHAGARFGEVVLMQPDELQSHVRLHGPALPAALPRAFQIHARLRTIEAPAGRSRRR